MKIAVVGAGAYGAALGKVLVENGHEVGFYDPIVESSSLDTVLDGADIVLIAVPSSALLAVLPELPKNVPVVVATKGILDDAIFNDFKDVMVLSGPGFANDIKAHKETLLTASDDRVVRLFETGYLKFDRADDVRGILLCGALKNVYAIFAGFLNLKPGTKEHEKYLNDVAKEMKTILEANGAMAETVEKACGKGDLRLTCGAPSRNYEFGQMIRVDDGYHSEKTVEGLTVLRELRDGGIAIPKTAKIILDLLRRSIKWS